MSEVVEGFAGGVAQGASIGAMFGGVGAPVGAVIGGVIGLVKGFGSKKKRKNAERARQQAIANAVKMLNKRRERANAYLSEEEEYKEKLLTQIMGNYYDIKESWEVLGEDQKAKITSKYGDVIAEMDTNLKTQLGMSEELFTETTKSITKMQETYLPALRKDLDTNETLRTDFVSKVDGYIGDTETVTDDAKSALDTIKSTGKTVGAENREARLEQRFADAERNFDKRNPNDVGTEQQKLSNMFKLAMAEGDQSANEQVLADRQAMQLRNEIAGNSANLINQARVRQEGGQSSYETDYAKGEISFEQKQQDAIRDNILRNMGIEGQDSMNRLKMITDKYNSMMEVDQAVAKGLISAQDATFLRKMGAEEDFQNTKGKVVDLHMQLDKEVQAIYQGQATKATNDIASIRKESSDFMKQGISSAMKTGMSGGFDGAGKAMKDKFSGMFADKYPNSNTQFAPKVDIAMPSGNAMGQPVINETYGGADASEYGNIVDTPPSYEPMMEYNAPLPNYEVPEGLRSYMGTSNPHGKKLQVDFAEGTRRIK